jgi:hypothetical protein
MIEVILRLKLVVVVVVTSTSKALSCRFVAEAFEAILSTPQAQVVVVKISIYNYN